MPFPFVGYILVLLAFFTVASVLYMVMREHQEVEEWYIPPDDKTSHPEESTPAPAAQVTAPPATGDEAQSKTEENRE